MRILITGSTGFLGGSLGRLAAQAGHEIAGAGRAPSAGDDWPGTYARVEDELDGISEVIDAFSPEVIFHAAGSASVGASFEDPFRDFRGSVLTCEKLFEGIRRSRVRPLIFVPSSAAVYGNVESLPIGEFASVSPISPYGLHRSVCETLARGWADAFGLRIVVFRFFSVFGPRQRRLLIWELFQQLAGASEEVIIEGTGAESRDFLYIDDAARAFLQLSQTLSESSARYFEIVNLASGHETTVAALADHLREIVAPHKKIRYRGLLRPGDPAHWRADISKLTSMISDWRPQPLFDSLAVCIQCWRERTVLHHGA